MKILEELIGALLLAYVLYRGINAIWIKPKKPSEENKE